MPFTPSESPRLEKSSQQQQQQEFRSSQHPSHPQPSPFSNFSLEYRQDNGSGFMSLTTDTSTISLNDEESARISLDGDNYESQRQESDDEEYPDIDVLPPLPGWMDEQEHHEGESDFPDIDTLPSFGPGTLPERRVQLLSQNDREEMRIHSKQNAIDDISRNFRCHRSECENDENSISHPRLRRQQVRIFPFLIPHFL